MRSQRRFPVRLRGPIVGGVAVAYRPGLNVAVARLLIAEVTKMRSPHTTGLECASPGISVRR